MRAISVLVVENSAADAESLMRELQRSEWLVDHAVANNERRLVEELAHRSWDLVISDFSLPGLHGLQALNIAKAADQTLPFICVSGTAGEEAAVAVLQAGADDFLVKGKLARLSLAVERALRESSERKARALAETAVRRSEERLRAVVESMGDTVFTVDLELRHDRIFGRRATPSGFASTRLLGRTAVEIWGEPLGGAMQNAMKRALGGERAMHEWTVELSDASLHFQTCFTALRSESSNIIGVVGTERDVTLQKLTDARLLAADRMASVGILASGVAHEIKNPLAAIAANVELAVGDVTSLSESANGQQKPVLQRLVAELADARESSARIRHMVQDLGVLSRGETDVTQPVDLHETIEAALRVTANQTRHAATIVRKFGSIPAVLGTEARLGQLLRNLIMNAVKAIPAGDASHNEIRITTFGVGGGADEAKRVVLEVADTGPSMNESMARRLFTPYFTTKPVGQGIGLELAICHRIVTSLGGRIAARSGGSSGNVFHVELPSASSAAPHKQAQAAQTSSTPPAQRRGRLLLIDDDRLVLNTLSRVFEREHEAVATLSANEALKIVAEQGPFDVIFCDLMMPNTSGMSFYEKLAKTSPRVADKVVFMTGGAFSADAEKFLTQVQNAHVAKPFDLEQVRALVRSRIAGEAGAGR